MTTRKAATPRPSLPASAPSPLDRAVTQMHVFREPEILKHVHEPSFEFSRNAKGDPSWTIKAGGESLGSLVNEVLALDDVVRRRLAAREQRDETIGKEVARG